VSDGYKTKDIDPLGEIKIVSVLMRPGVSQNGREFSEEVIRKAVANAQERIAEGMYGSVEPGDKKLLAADISHRVDKMEVTKDGVVYGTCTTVDTPKGRALKEMLMRRDVQLVPEGRVIRRSKDGVIEDMELIGVSVVRNEELSR
jgi:hypothetical protein